MDQFPNFEKRGGLLIVIVQDVETKEVLTHGFVNRAALWMTLREHQLWLWSTSRRKMWCKGESSGNRMEVRSIKTDCDGDALLVGVKVLGNGEACHLGRRFCFDQLVSQSMVADRLIFSDVTGTIVEPAFQEPEGEVEDGSDR